MNYNFITNWQLKLMLETIEKLGYEIILKQHHKIDCPGVYIVCDRAWNVLYIGEAKNIYNRLSKTDHPLKKKIKNFKFEDYNTLCLIFHLDSFRWEVESGLISFLRPVYNDIRYLHGCKKKYR